MKKLVALALAAIVVLPTGAAAQKGGKKQEVKGTIALPAPYQDNSGCFAGLHRRLAILTQEQANGDLGYHFDVDPGTGGKPFVLQTEGGVGTVDLDIYFYQKFGTAQDVAGDPLSAGSPGYVQFSTRESGGEADIVPKGYPKAIVCVYAGDQGAAAAASFTYTAGARVKLPKKG